MKKISEVLRDYNSPYLYTCFGISMERAKEIELLFDKACQDIVNSRDAKGISNAGFILKFEAAGFIPAHDGELAFVMFNIGRLYEANVKDAILVSDVEDALDRELGDLNINTKEE